MKRTAAENKRRSDIYKIVKKATGSSVLARQYRDRGIVKLTKLAPEIKVREDNRTIYYYVPTTLKKLTKDERLKKQVANRIIRNKRVRQQRKIARDLNYTPDEAKKLSSMSEKNFNEIIGKKTIINKKGRAERWAYMSGQWKNGKRRKFDPKIVEECELINLEAGYSIDSRFGWAVYYFYYINGGSIAGWSTYVDQNPNIPHAVAYRTENYFKF